MHIHVMDMYCRCTVLAFAEIFNDRSQVEFWLTSFMIDKAELWVCKPASRIWKERDAAFPKWKKNLPNNTNKGTLDISLSRTLMRAETCRLRFKKLSAVFLFGEMPAWVFHFFPCLGLGRCPERLWHKEGEREREGDGERDILRGKDSYSNSEKNKPPLWPPLFFHNYSLQNCCDWYEPHTAPLALKQPYTPLLPQ